MQANQQNRLRPLQLTNLHFIPGHKITKHFGLVSGSTVQTQHAGRDIMAFFRNIIGGEIASYSQLMAKSRDEAMARVIKHAEDAGANAILNIRFSTSSVMECASEIFVYGTAVHIEPDHD
ncbi:MAG: YbjQ family protein [Alphaproteobacteria bacterium]